MLNILNTWLHCRVIKLELAKEAGDLHDRCIPRKPKGKKDGYLVISCSAQGNNKG